MHSSAMLWQVEVDRDCGLPIGDMANLLLVLGAGTVVRVTVCYQSSLSVVFGFMKKATPSRFRVSNSSLP